MRPGGAAAYVFRRSRAELAGLRSRRDPSSRLSLKGEVGLCSAELVPAEPVAKKLAQDPDCNTTHACSLGVRKGRQREINVFIPVRQISTKLDY